MMMLDERQLPVQMQIETTNFRWANSIQWLVAKVYYSRGVPPVPTSGGLIKIRVGCSLRQWLIGGFWYCATSTVELEWAAVARVSVKLAPRSCNHLVRFSSGWRGEKEMRARGQKEQWSCSLMGLLLSLSASYVSSLLFLDSLLKGRWADQRMDYVKRTTEISTTRTNTTTTPRITNQLTAPVNQNHSHWWWSQSPKRPSCSLECSPTYLLGENI